MPPQLLILGDIDDDDDDDEEEEDDVDEDNFLDDEADMLYDHPWVSMASMF